VNTPSGKHTQTRHRAVESGDHQLAVFASSALLHYRDLINSTADTRFSPGSCRSFPPKCMSSSPSLSYPPHTANETGLSPLKAINRDRSHSRNSSRNSARSIRAPSPSISLDDPGKPMILVRSLPRFDRALVAIRNQVSTLKHTIRHQQAQVHSLENILLSGPRGLQDTTNDMTSPTSPPPSSYTPVASTSTKMKRRSSYDILQGIAGPESNLPLPKRDGLDENGIQEGVPMSFGVGPASPPSYKRASSPMRTLSRKPSLPFHQ